jgi:hypoxanthine-DNA glycosylase
VKTAAAFDRCFAPIVDRNARTLILGSLPGRMSLEMQQYYAHPQNAFWKLMAALFCWNPALGYARHVRSLQQNRIALWDVCEAAERPGSLDSAIVSVTANDFATFFRKYRGIDRVFFNGRRSEEIFRRRVLPKIAAKFPHIEYDVLPSTSPAHASLSFEKKLARWGAIAGRSQG